MVRHEAYLRLTLKGLPLDCAHQSWWVTGTWLMPLKPKLMVLDIEDWGKLHKELTLYTGCLEGLAEPSRRR
jgi:hypothetical protein